MTALPFPGNNPPYEPTPTPTSNPITITLAEFNEAVAAYPENNPSAGQITRAQQILDGVSEWVNRHARLAPTPIKNIAVIRMGGYLAQSDFGGIQAESIGGVRSVNYMPNAAGAAARNSGAMALLAPWRIRRGGAIG